MKRVVIFGLAVALSLALCACSGQNKKYEKYGAIIDSLENGNYQSAIDLIEDMAQQGSGEAAGDSATEATAPPLTPEQLTWQTNAVGAWVKTDGTGFTLKADGTCAVDGKDYTWTVSEAAEIDAVVDILEDQQKVYQMHISVNEKYGYRSASLSKRIGEYSWELTGSIYYRSEEYTAVEITNENWQDYFEVKELVELEENSFGEVDALWGYTYFRLKDTCGAINSGLSSVAMEYSSVSTCQDITVDLENKTYTPVGKVKNTTNNNGDRKLAGSTDCNGQAYYGDTIASFCALDVDKNLTCTVWRSTDIEILRIQGTLYVVK